MASIRAVAGYFDKIGWRYRLVEPSGLITGVSLRIPFTHYSIPIECEVTAHWVIVRAILTRRIIADSRLALATFLSDLNSRCYQVRFYIVESCVAVQSDVPAVNWSQEALRNALDAVGRYAYSWGEAITVLAGSAVASRVFLQSHHSSRENSDGSGQGELLDFDISVNRLPE